MKLNQSFDSLYELDFFEYSLILNVLKNKIEEANEKIKEGQDIFYTPTKPVNLNIPDNLKLK